MNDETDETYPTKCNEFHDTSVVMFFPLPNCLGKPVIVHEGTHSIPSSQSFIIPYDQSVTMEKDGWTYRYDKELWGSIVADSGLTIDTFISRNDSTKMSMRDIEKVRVQMDPNLIHSCMGTGSPRVLYEPSQVQKINQKCEDLLDRFCTLATSPYDVDLCKRRPLIPRLINVESDNNWIYLYLLIGIGIVLLMIVLGMSIMGSMAIEKKSNLSQRGVDF